jgi:hypothetical protein
MSEIVEAEGDQDQNKGLSSYVKIYSLGHRYLENLLIGDVLVEEKIDGSQFGFGRRSDQLFFRSRGAQIYPETADKLFKVAVDYICSIKDRLEEGYTYRGEVLHAPRHNTLTYARIPKHNVVIFDIETAEGQHFMSPEGKALEAMKLDLEVVPVFYKGPITDAQGLKSLLEENSFLGGCKLEGIVIKNYDQFGKDGKVLMGKWVNESFKEAHSTEWKKLNPNKGDLLEGVVRLYKTKARWEKNIIHAREEGRLQDAPNDIGMLMKDIQEDIKTECSAEIKERLFEYMLPKILRGATAGFAEFYKAKLLERQFK